jgi:hypothetical protein
VEEVVEREVFQEIPEDREEAAETRQPQGHLLAEEAELQVKEITEQEDLTTPQVNTSMLVAEVEKDLLEDHPRPLTLVLDHLQLLQVRM